MTTLLIFWLWGIGFATPPNILIILTDDQGWGDIGYHTYPGRVHIDTPNMDSLATSGIRWERFYPTAVCSVTRATLLTGRSTLRTSVNNSHGLDVSEHIMPQTFSAAGYQTYLTGKWHCGGPENNICYKTVNGQNVRVIQEGDAYRPFNRGWISHYGEYGVIDSFTHWSTDDLQPDKPDWWLNGTQYADADPTQHTDAEGHNGYSTDLLADAAVSRILNRDPAKPLLLYLAFNAIHGPVEAPPDYLAKYGNPSDPTHYIPDVPTRTIAASVNCMDTAMGRVLSALDTAGITNNTIVVFMSDNGGENATGGSDLPLRGAKSDPYEGGIRTPGGIRWPGHLAGGLAVTHCVTTSGATVVCDSTTGLYPGMALAGTGLAYGTTVVSVTDTTHFILSASPTTPSTPSSITITAGVISNQFIWVGDIFPTLCAAAGVTPLNTKPFDGINMWPALQSISGANPDGTQTRFQTNPDGTKNTATTNVSPLVTPASPTVAFNTFTDPVSGQPKVFKDIYSPTGPTAIILTNCLTVAGTAVRCDSTVGLASGQSVYGVGIKGGSTVASVTDATHFVLSDPPNVPSSPSTITLNIGFPVNELFNIQDDPYETTDLMLSVNQTALGLTATQIQQMNSIVSSLQTTISSIKAEIYPPYIGPPLITNTVSQGGTTQLYAPFTCYPSKTAPVVHWRKNSANLTDGGNISGANSYVQAVAPDGKIYTPGAYTTTLTLANVQPGDVGIYDVVVSNTNTNVSPIVTQNTTSTPGTLTVTGSPPVISSVSTGPTTPTYLDAVWVTAQVSASPGASLSQVGLTYDLGAPVSTKVFQETFNVTSTNAWTGTGAINTWTVNAATAGYVRQAVGTSNHTAPIGLTACATTSGSATVTCATTANLWPGMALTGPNVPAGTKIISITDATTFVMSASALATGTGLGLTAAGMTLTNCTTTAASTTVMCDSTVGLVAGMALSGSGLANNATVSSITNATTFAMNVAPTTPGSALTLTAANAAAEFQNGTANLTDCMFATTNAINAAGSSGYVEFYVQTRDLAATNNNQWTFQVSSDGGTTWNTRISEDWISKTVNLGNCVLNAAGNANGSTTVTCASTAGLTTGCAVAGPNVYVTCTTTSGNATMSCSNTTGLAAGMFLQGTGIANNTRILSLVANTSVTMSANATASGSTSVAATFFSSNATVGSITNGSTFVLSSAAYVNTSASPITATATTINHGFQLYHYDLAGAELGANMKIGFQFAGYTPTSPTRAPRVDVDDIIVATTANPPAVTLAMYDDGFHGDGAAGDGVFGAAIPVQAGGVTVNYSITATDSNGASTTNPVSGEYDYTVNPALTDTTITSAEFLTIPTDQSVTLNAVAATDQDAFVEFGTVSGFYTSATPIIAFPAAGGPIQFTLTGLLANTKYYYRLRYRNTGTSIFNARGERSFRTARPRGSPFVFTVTADPHLDFDTDPTLLTQTLANVALDQPDLHIDLGDIFMTDKMYDTVAGIPAQYGGGFPNQARVNARALILRSYFERTCHSVPYFFTLGNHEAEYGYLFNTATDPLNNIPAWNLIARKTYYPAPVPGTFYTGNATTKDYSGGSLGLLEDYYAWEWGDALFIVLDPFWNTVNNPSAAKDAWNWSLGQAQYNWLATTLRNSSAKYKFIFTHHLIGGTWTLADGATSNCAARGGVEVAPYFEWGGRNADGSNGFATHRPGWAMPIHNLLVANHVNVVFHGHDHLYGYQTLDGIVYLECPQPGTPNYAGLGSAADGKYTTGVLMPNSGHIRVTVTPGSATAEYVRAFRATDISATQHNRDVSHSFAVSPAIYPPIEITAKTGNLVTFRWTAVANKPYSVQWSPDLVNWTVIDTVTFTGTSTHASYTDSNPLRMNQLKAFYRVSYTP